MSGFGGLTEFFGLCERRGGKPKWYEPLRKVGGGEERRVHTRVFGVKELLYYIEGDRGEFILHPHQLSIQSLKLTTSPFHMAFHVIRLNHQLISFHHLPWDSITCSIGHLINPSHDLHPHDVVVHMITPQNYSIQIIIPSQSIK